MLMHKQMRMQIVFTPRVFHVEFWTPIRKRGLAVIRSINGTWGIRVVFIKLTDETKRKFDCPFLRPYYRANRRRREREAQELQDFYAFRQLRCGLCKSRKPPWYFALSLWPELGLMIIRCVFAANTNKQKMHFLFWELWHCAHPLTSLQSAKCQLSFQDAVGIRKLNRVLLG